MEKKSSTFVANLEEEAENFIKEMELKRLGFEYAKRSVTRFIRSIINTKNFSGSAIFLLNMPLPPNNAEVWFLLTQAEKVKSVQEKIAYYQAAQKVTDHYGIELYTKSMVHNLSEKEEKRNSSPTYQPSPLNNKNTFTYNR